MRPRSRIFAASIAALSVLGGAVAILGLLVGAPAEDRASTTASQPVWTETRWPFPQDQWDAGKAFRCKASNCGVETVLYVRAKIGFCNCVTGIADDEDLDRMSDFDLVGGEISPRAAGRPIAVGRMHGRSRTYSSQSRNGAGPNIVSIVFNDRCDMVVATIVLPNREPTNMEARALEFLNSSAVLHWVETSLGL